jgi:hypothetical protein
MHHLKQIYYFFRYDIPYGIKNLIYFFGPVWDYQPCDFAYSLNLFLYGLKRTRNDIDRGPECDETRIPCVAAMDEAINLLTRAADDDINMTDDEWDRIWKIIAGSKDIPGSGIRGWWT